MRFYNFDFWFYENQVTYSQPKKHFKYTYIHCVQKFLDHLNILGTTFPIKKVSI